MKATFQEAANVVFFPACLRGDSDPKRREERLLRSPNEDLPAAPGDREPLRF